VAAAHLRSEEWERNHPGSLDPMRLTTPRYPTWPARPTAVQVPPIAERFAGLGPEGFIERMEQARVREHISMTNAHLTTSADGFDEDGLSDPNARPFYQAAEEALTDRPMSLEECDRSMHDPDVSALLDKLRAHGWEVIEGEWDGTAATSSGTRVMAVSGLFHGE
jgi:hypothetical protein